MVHRDKLRSLVLTIAAHPEVKSLGLTKLWKLIYFADVAALREEGATISGSEFVKYPHGPVPSRGERILKTMKRAGELRTEQQQQAGYSQTLVVGIARPDTAVFSTREREIIDAVCQELGGRTAKALSERSHQEPAWAWAADMDKLDPELMHYGPSVDPKGL